MWYDLFCLVLVLCLVGLVWGFFDYNSALLWI